MFDEILHGYSSSRRKGHIGTSELLRSRRISHFPLCKDWKSTNVDQKHGGPQMRVWEAMVGSGSGPSMSNAGLSCSGRQAKLPLRTSSHCHSHSSHNQFLSGSFARTSFCRCFVCLSGFGFTSASPRTAPEATFRMP